MEDKSFKIEVDITFEELHRQNKYQLFTSRFYIIMMSILFLIFIGSIIFLIVLGKEFLFSAVYLVLYILLQPLSNYLSSKRYYKRVKGKNNYAFSEYGIIHEKSTSQASTIYKWKDVHKVLENDKAFIFYPAFSEFFVIPKRCFTDKEQISFLKVLLERNVERCRVKMKVTA